MQIKKNIIISHENEISTYCGKIIKRIRRERGMTGDELARKLNISQQQMSRYERGVNKISLSTLFNLSIILNVPLEKIIKYILVEMEGGNSDNPILLKAIIASSDTTYFY
ncbi:MULTISPECIES: helix-turn-helix domain-containing protein [Providencia]|uniref:helix-turn-helix domain-containing protein n=1 Tax=Providencia TaxID=586 RepID=UPI00201DF5F5|nr:helix-turn-helix transcriptional regulator [Providencia stuartii]UQZ14171.1 helix-turn-helix domain-containing protein [Providencia stuartii]HEM8139364.1 helix-turn-helix transcriptional regulator [Providencia rettgeri]